MNIIHYRDAEILARSAAKIVLDEIEKNPDSLICAASGNSPLGLYRRLSETHQINPGYFTQLRIIKLDEWLGLPSDDPATCEYFLKKELLDPLGIPTSRYISFHTSPEDPETECKRIQQILDSNGPIDLCILGLGINGHLGLIEPGEFLFPHCHVATLAEETTKHSMLAGKNRTIKKGLTLGISDILNSRKVMLIISGADKKLVCQKLIEPAITTSLPASFLWLHPQVDLLIDDTIFLN